jgi:hypothetical protein
MKTNFTSYHPRQIVCQLLHWVAAVKASTILTQKAEKRLHLTRFLTFFIERAAAPRAQTYVAHLPNRLFQHLIGKKNCQCVPFLLGMHVPLNHDFERGR